MAGPYRAPAREVEPPAPAEPRWILLDIVGVATIAIEVVALAACAVWTALEG